MQFGRFHYRRRSSRQQGYLLLTIMLFAVLILIALTAELPSITSQIRHDREEELIHRGTQYARAIKKYYKKFGRYPLSADQLLETNHVRFLRKKYKDPLTGEEFALLHQGDVQLTLKAPMGTTGTSTSSQTSSLFGSSQGSGVFGSSGQSSAQQTGSQPDISSSGSSSGSKGGFSSSGSNPKFGGGPVIGVASSSKKQSFHVFNEKDHYKDWAFIYDPTLDRVQGLITGPYNGTPTFGGGQIPGAVSAGKLNQSQNQSGTPNSSAFGQQQKGF
jgi:type II secretory pathway pseudopilin PulG